MRCTTWRKRFGRISVCPRGGKVSVSGHVVGQGQASLGSSPLLLAAFPGSGQSEANRGGHPDRNPAERRTIQHRHPVRPQTRVRTRTRMGRKDRRIRSRVQPRLQVFGRIQEQSLLLIPSSSLCLGTRSSCFMISVGYLAPGRIKLPGREGGRGPANSPLPRASRGACLYEFSSTHMSVPPVSATRHIS